MNENTKNEVAEMLAREHLGFETLVARNWDRLDFKEVGVASLKAALTAALQIGFEAGFELGFDAGKRSHTKR